MCARGRPGNWVLLGRGGTAGWFRRVCVEHADFVQADAAALPLRSGSFDHVFLIGVLGEIPDRRGALAEFRRVLRAGGHLSFSEQLPDPDFIPRGALRRLLRPAGFTEVTTRGRLWYTSTWQPLTDCRERARPRTSHGQDGGAVAPL